MDLTGNALGTVVAGNTQFALELYDALRRREGNLFFSPFSLSTALAMTYAGARGRTAVEMAATLRFMLSQPQLHPAFAALVQGLQGGDEPRKYQFAVANALWGQAGYGFLPGFVELTRQNYGAGLREIDFAAVEAARAEINAWVEAQIQGRIRDLLKPGIIVPLTRLILTNAIYFKGDWVEPFARSATREEPFLTAADEKVTVPMMRRTELVKYLETDRFQALELPYAGGDLAMAVFLPREAGGLPAFEQALNASTLEGWLSKLGWNEVEVHLPRFKLAEEFLLNEVLSGMGMPLAFDSARADFSGIDGGNELYLFAVVHKAFVEVNEEGTEAAAATGVAMAGRAMAIHRPPVFRADHPFVFLIRDTRSGSILFMGRVTNPR